MTHMSSEESCTEHLVNMFSLLRREQADQVLLGWDRLGFVEQLV